MVRRGGGALLIPVDPTKLAAILARITAGERVPCCEYLRVDWSGAVTNYYGCAAYNDEAPFTAIGHTIEPRLIRPKGDPFHEYEINSDLRTESVPIVFSDIDKSIKALFQTYSSGVACSFFLYYPDEALTVETWSGQLQAPQVYGWKQIKCVATNGYRSRELQVPGRGWREECTANIFGGLLPDTDSVRSSLCPYDKHLGGSEGLFKTGVTPFSDCPKDIAACQARFGHTRYFGGFNLEAASVLIDPHRNNGWLAVSTGNASGLTSPHRVAFGTVYMRGLLLGAFRPERDSRDPEHSFVSTLFFGGEGPVSTIYNFKVNDRFIGQNHINFRLGTRGQAPTGYATNISNFSSTWHVFARDGYVDLTDPTSLTASDLSAECVVKAFSEVCVYTSASPVTKTRIWSDNRVWALMECYKNQKWGMGYAESLFTIADWMTAATWSDLTVTHTITFADGEVKSYTSRRSTFNAILEGRPVGEQVEDICRSGGITVPFQHEGELTIRPFRAATAGELTAARIFTDTGSTVNIVWDGQPLIELSQTPDNKVVNEIEFRFEDAAKQGAEQVKTTDDPNQKLKAGRQLGPDRFLAVPKKYSAFGCTSLAESLRFGRRMLWFGEFDEGGTMNNGRLTITMPFEQALGVERYDFIKPETALLDGVTIGAMDGTVDLTEPFTYARVLRIRKISHNRAQITAQAYNHTAYTAFETEVVTTPSDAVIEVRDSGTELVNGFYGNVGLVDGKDSYDNGSVVIAWNSTQWEFQYNGIIFYYSTDAVDFPYDVTTWVADIGLLPLPTVLAAGQPPVYAPPESVTIDAPTYNATTGIMEVTIN